MSTLKTEPLLIEAEDVPAAWRAVFNRLMTCGVDAAAPVTVSARVGDLTAVEESPMAAAIDNRVRELRQLDADKYGHLQSVRTVANTIFPTSYWNPDLPDPAGSLYGRYGRAWPWIKRGDSRNNRGSYFQRITASRPKKQGDPPVNQLKTIIENFNGGNRRGSALQATVFDAGLDHVNTKQLGFPCLHHISFTPLGGGDLMVTGYYASQYAFDRAYGNYLGLCRLGEFVAGQIGMKLVRMTCTAGRVKLGSVGKKALLPLKMRMGVVAAAHASAPGSNVQVP